MNYCEAGERLVKAYLEAEREKRKVMAEQHIAKGKDAVRTFECITGIAPTDWTVTGHEPAIVLVGDLKVKHIRYQGDDWFHLWGVCPKCGEPTWSRYCYNAATLGAQLVNFEPDAEHARSCPAKVKPLSWRERLRLAWRILREGR